MALIVKPDIQAIHKSDFHTAFYRFGRILPLWAYFV
jgi:hypothetical protein